MITSFNDVSYGPHERNVLDIWLADSSAPTPIYVMIHGGGFCGGDKTGLAPEIRDGLLNVGISVASINYRLSDTDPYPAAMLDGARSVQYIRSRAEEWNIDKNRVAAGGGSAGSGITFWFGFRADMAEPGSDDPVARESTHLTCIASWQAQSSYNPHYVRTIISGNCHKHPVLQTFFRLTEEEFDTPRAMKIFEEVDFIRHVSADSPPVFLWYTTPDLPMTPDLEDGPGIHHPKFGMVLKERMAELGVECELHTREECPEIPDDQLLPRFFAYKIAFLSRHLLGA